MADEIKNRQLVHGICRSARRQSSVKEKTTPPNWWISRLNSEVHSHAMHTHTHTYQAKWTSIIIIISHKCIMGAPIFIELTINPYYSQFYGPKTNVIQISFVWKMAQKKTQQNQKQIDRFIQFHCHGEFSISFLFMVRISILGEKTHIPTNKNSSSLSSGMWDKMRSENHPLMIRYEMSNDLLLQMTLFSPFTKANRIHKEVEEKSSNNQNVIGKLDPSKSIAIFHQTQNVRFHWEKSSY